MSFENISAIILAGGKSSRLGRDKCDVIFEGETFLNRQVKKVEGLGISDVYVSGYRGTKCNNNIIEDDFHLGPMSGIYTCIDKIKNDKALVLSVDVPLIPENELIKLIQFAQKSDSLITVLSHNGKIEPLIAVYDKRVMPFTKAIIEEKKDYSMKNLMNTVSYDTYVSYENDRYFININYEKDLQELNSK